jgi:hypothetical protein
MDLNTFQNPGTPCVRRGLHAIATVLDSEAVLIKSSVLKHPTLARGVGRGMGTMVE